MFMAPIGWDGLVMTLVIGLDPGGPYTDAALLDTAKGTIVATAKALTTRDNLADGLGAARGAAARAARTPAGTPRRVGAPVRWQIIGGSRAAEHPHKPGVLSWECTWSSLWAHFFDVHRLNQLQFVGTMLLSVFPHSRNSRLRKL